MSKLHPLLFETNPQNRSSLLKIEHSNNFFFKNWRINLLIEQQVIKIQGYFGQFLNYAPPEQSIWSSRLLNTLWSLNKQWKIIKYTLWANTLFYSYTIEMSVTFGEVIFKKQWEKLHLPHLRNFQNQKGQFWREEHTNYEENSISHAD